MALQDSFNSPLGATSAVVNTTFGRAMTFQASSTYTCTSVKMRLIRGAGATTATITCTIRATTDGGGGTTIPTGGDLANLSGSIANSSVGTSLAWYEFTFTGALLTSGVTYAIVMRCDEANAQVDPEIGYQAGNPYADGNACFDNNDDNWTSQADPDFNFEVYGISSIVELSGTIAAQSTVSGNLTAGVVTELSGTIAAQSSVSGDLGSVTVGLDVVAAYIKRLVVAGNNEIWYEDI